MRLANAPGTFQVAEEVIFGPPGYETRLNDETAPAFEEFIKTVVEARSPHGDRRDPLWRMYPERWLESLVFKNVSAVDSSLDPAHVYSQVPAFSASDRAMIDVLTCTRDARLAVLELKADEDIHLPLQGLDYWARVSVAPQPRRVPAIWIFLRHATLASTAIADADRTITAGASGHGYSVALFFAGD